MAFYDSATLEAAIETFLYTGRNPLHVKECLLKEIHDDAAKPQKEKVLAVLDKQFTARGEPCDDEISFKDDESGKTWLYTSSFNFVLFKNAASLLEMIDPPKGSLGDYVNLLLGLRTAVLRSGQLWGFETDTLLRYATMTDAQRRQIILGFVDYAEYHQREKKGNQAMNGVLSVGDYLDKTHHEAVFEIIRSIIGKGHCGVADLVNLRNCVLGAQTLHITPPQLNKNSWEISGKTSRSAIHPPEDGGTTDTG